MIEDGVHLLYSPEEGERIPYSLLFRDLLHRVPGNPFPFDAEREYGSAVLVSAVVGTRPEFLAFFGKYAGDFFRANLCDNPVAELEQHVECLVVHVHRLAVVSSQLPVLDDLREGPLQGYVDFLVLEVLQGLGGKGLGLALKGCPQRPVHLDALLGIGYSGVPCLDALGLVLADDGDS